MFKVIVINGKPRSGKDSFVEMCDSFRGVYVNSASTVDLVKDIAEECGWDGTKTPKHRQFLSDLKDLLSKWNDVPFKDVLKSITIARHDYSEWYEASYNIGLFFVYSREPKEIKRWVKTCDAITLKLERLQTGEEQQTNHSDLEVDQYEYDYTIVNNGTLDDLREKAREFVNTLKARFLEGAV